MNNQHSWTAVTASETNVYPPEGQSVLVRHVNEPGNVGIDVAYWINNAWHCNVKCGPGRVVTHWIPLPELPEELK